MLQVIPRQCFERWGQRFPPKRGMLEHGYGQRIAGQLQSFELRRIPGRFRGVVLRVHIFMPDLVGDDGRQFGCREQPKRRASYQEHRAAMQTDPRLGRIDHLHGVNSASMLRREKPIHECKLLSLASSESGYFAVPRKRGKDRGLLLGTKGGRPAQFEIYTCGGLRIGQSTISPSRGSEEWHDEGKEDAKPLSYVARQ